MFAIDASHRNFQHPRFELQSLKAGPQFGGLDGRAKVSHIGRPRRRVDGRAPSGISQGVGPEVSTKRQEVTSSPQQIVSPPNIDK